MVAVPLPAVAGWQGADYAPGADLLHLLVQVHLPAEVLRRRPLHDGLGLPHADLPLPARRRHHLPEWGRPQLYSYKKNKKISEKIKHGWSHSFCCKSCFCTAYLIRSVPGEGTGCGSLVSEDPACWLGLPGWRLVALIAELIVPSLLVIPGCSLVLLATARNLVRVVAHAELGVEHRSGPAALDVGLALRTGPCSNQLYNMFHHDSTLPSYIGSVEIQSQSQYALLVSGCGGYSQSSQRVDLGDKCADASQVRSLARLTIPRAQSIPPPRLTVPPLRPHAGCHWRVALPDFSYPACRAEHPRNPRSRRKILTCQQLRNLVQSVGWGARPVPPSMRHCTPPLPDSRALWNVWRGGRGCGSDLLLRFLPAADPAVAVAAVTTSTSYHHLPILHAPCSIS